MSAIKYLKAIIFLTLMIVLAAKFFLKRKKTEKKPQKLTAEIIDATPDSELLFIINDNLSDKASKGNYAKEVEIMLSWTKSQQAIYVIWCLEAEVNNGGFNQFYFNSNGKYHKLLPDLLRLVGAVKFANLIERVNLVYEKENNIITKEWEGTFKGENPLNKFDDEFQTLYDEESLFQLQIDYIRQHKQDFIDK